MRHEFTIQSFLQNNENTSQKTDPDPVLRIENAEQVHYGLSHLSLPHREILTLFFMQDFSLEEIATVLDMPVGTVKSRLYYAKRSMKTVLGQKEQRNE